MRCKFFLTKSLQNRFHFLFLVSLLAGCSFNSSLKNKAPDEIPLATMQEPGERSKYEALGQKFVVAAQGKVAALAAKKMIELGGNIMDAAVAASFVISVERPQSTGIGGGGFLLFHEAKSGRTYAVDFRERAPLRAFREMYLDEKGNVVPGKSLNGIHSVAVPGLVAGVLELHKKFGQLPLREVMAPAIQLAEDGLVVYPRLEEALRARLEVLKQYPSTAKIFLKPSGETYVIGEKIIQKDLARSLRFIVKQREKAFYQGEITKKILATSKQYGGLLQEEDFRSYKVKWREAISGFHRGYQIFSMPPPSSGGVHVIQILNVLEEFPLKEDGFLSTKNIHREASAMQMAFADRAKYLGDPDFVRVPVAWLLSKDYAKSLRAQIGEKARSFSQVKPGEESLETTHFSMMDAAGNAISSTQTINFAFGSGLVAEGTGIFLNDEMDDFSTKPGAANVFGALGGEANAVASRKTPLSSMSPVIVMKEGLPMFAVGAPGGTRILTCVAQTLLHYLDFQMPLYESVQAVRLHHQWFPDEIAIDAPGPSQYVLKELQKMGYQVKVKKDAVPCRVEAVSKEGNMLHGVADARDLGASEAL